MDLTTSIDASGEGPCEGDDEDCEMGSGTRGVEELEPANKSGHEDIIFNPPEQSPNKEEKTVPDPTPKPDTESEWSTTTDTIVVTVNMTETPPKKNGFGATRRRNVDESNADPTVVVPEEGVGEGDEAVGEAVEPTLGNSQSPRTSLGLNIGLIIGIAAGVVLLLLGLAYALYKYKSRDEENYKADETKNYRYDSCNTKPPPPAAPGGVIIGSMQKSGTSTKPKKKDVKEWYV